MSLEACISLNMVLYFIFGSIVSEYGWRKKSAENVNLELICPTDL